MKQVLMMGGAADGTRRMLHDSTNVLDCNEGRYFVHDFETDTGTIYLATLEENHQAHDLMAMLFAGYRGSADAE